MPNTLNPRPFTALEADMTRMGFSPASIRAMRDILMRTDKVLTDKGEIQGAANITGRTEQLSTTLAHVAATGNFDSMGNVNDTSTDHLTDGTGSPLTGGKRGFQALDSNNRLANSFRATAVNVSNTPTSSATLSNNGVSTAIAIAASSNQFPPGLISYNSGSVDPGGFGITQFVYADDPIFAGGAVIYVVTSSVQNQTAAEGRIPFGSITTAAASSRTGGGNTGGDSGDPGGRGFIKG